jgi:transcriptional regulator PpsR
MSSDSPKTADFDNLSAVAKEVAEVVARVASDIALVIDPDGVIRNVAEGKAALPVECSQWVGQRWVDTASADTQRKIELLLQDTQTSGVSQRREVNHPVVHGDSVPLAWTAVRLGERGPVLAVGRDLRAVAAIQRQFLDAQHEMELDYWQRRHADNRYRTLFQVARDAVIVLDAATFEVLEANDAAQAVMEAQSATSDQRNFVLSVAAAARTPLTELLVAARGSGRASEVRLRLGTQSQDWDVSVTPFTVGERLQLLLRARHHESPQGEDSAPAMMRSLVESTPDAVVITDSSGHILLANTAFVSLVQQGNEARLKGQQLSDMVGDRSGAWRDVLSRTRLQGLCARSPLLVTIGELSVSVEVSSTLLTEGEQERLGFTLRLVEPSRPASMSYQQDQWAPLNALLAQVGLVPMATLLRESSQAVERQILRTALRLSSGQVDRAAQMLVMQPQSLSMRLHDLNIVSNDNDDDAPVLSQQRHMN